MSERLCILLTGGRAAVTLELARMLARAGHRVLMGEQIWWHLSRHSRALDGEFRLPWPTREFPAFARALAQIIEGEQVDLLIPTCEELFHVARARPQLPARCRVLAPPIEALERVHDKLRFAAAAREHGLEIPATRRLHTRAELEACVGEALVLKPAYSRFAARTIIRPTDRSQLVGIEPERETWLAQDFVEGRHYCTWGLAAGGRLIAHVAYETRFTLGLGASITFEAVEHAGVEAWVERFVAGERLDGLVAFDLIEARDGVVYGLECNPRLTSGFHLFADDPRILAALCEPASIVERLHPRSSRPAMLGVSMLLYLLGKVRTRAQWRAWAAEFRRCREVVASRWDPVPVVWRYLWLAGILLRARKLGVPAQQAVSVDIEYNGN